MKINSKIAVALFALVMAKSITDCMVIRRNERGMRSNKEQKPVGRLERKLMDEIQKEKDKNRMLKDLLKKQENISKDMDEKINSANEGKSSSDLKDNQDNGHQEPLSKITSDNDKSRELNTGNQNDKKDKPANNDNKSNSDKSSESNSDKSRELKQTSNNAYQSKKLKFSRKMVSTNKAANNSANVKKPDLKSFDKHVINPRFNRNVSVNNVNQKRVTRWNNNKNHFNVIRPNKHLRTSRRLRKAPQFRKRLQAKSVFNHSINKRVTKMVAAGVAHAPVNRFNTRFGTRKVVRRAAFNTKRHLVSNSWTGFKTPMKKLLRRKTPQQKPAYPALSSRKAPVIKKIALVANHHSNQVQSNLRNIHNNQSITTNTQVNYNKQPNRVNVQTSQSNRQVKTNYQNKRPVRPNFRINRPVFTRNRAMVNKKPNTFAQSHNTNVVANKMLGRIAIKPNDIHRKLVNKRVAVNQNRPNQNNRPQNHPTIQHKPQKWNAHSRKLAKTDNKNTKKNKRALNEEEEAADEYPVKLMNASISYPVLGVVNVGSGEYDLNIK